MTGLAGSGKSTLACHLTTEIKKTKPNVVYIDGDLMRDVLPVEMGHSLDERLKLALSYARTCKMLADQGLWVVAAVIGMFYEVQDWNRENIEDYVEILVSVPMEELIKRDKKALYSEALSGKISNVVGVDIPAEAPKCPEVEIHNYDGQLPDHAIKQVLKFWGPNSDQSLVGSKPIIVKNLS